jgi:hypothetical protein
MPHASARAQAPRQPESQPRGSGHKEAVLGAAVRASPSQSRFTAPSASHGGPAQDSDSRPPSLAVRAGGPPGLGLARARAHRWPMCHCAPPAAAPCTQSRAALFHRPAVQRVTAQGLHPNLGVDSPAQAGPGRPARAGRPAQRNALPLGTHTAAVTALRQAPRKARRFERRMGVHVRHRLVRALSSRSGPSSRFPVSRRLKPPCRRDSCNAAIRRRTRPRGA